MLDEPIKIDKGIPSVPQKSPRPYPFDLMEPGDSFFVQDGIGYLRVRASWTNRLNPDKFFVVRKRIEDGVESARCWRIK